MPAPTVGQYFLKPPKENRSLSRKSWKTRFLAIYILLGTKFDNFLAISSQNTYFSIHNNSILCKNIDPCPHNDNLILKDSVQQF